MTGDFTMQDRPARHDAAAPRGWTVVDGRPDETELRQVLDAIAEAVEPERIILFGSAARAPAPEAAGPGLTASPAASFTPSRRLRRAGTRESWRRR